MVRKVYLLLIIFLLCGCNKIENQETEYSKFVNLVVKNDNKYVNNTSRGYKFYLPKGVIVKKSVDYNMTLLSNDVNMYFYTDIVSYYYKKNNSETSGNYDYYKEINDNSYLIVDENNGIYYVKFYYNYSTIEFCCKKEDVPELITLSSIILNSVEFNDSIIENELKSGYNKSEEKKYKIDNIDKSESSFSQYLNSYVEEVEEKKELPN